MKIIANNLPVFIVLCPLFAALLCPIISYFTRVGGRIIVILASALSFVMSIFQLIHIVQTRSVSYWFGGYRPPYGIEFAIDSLSGTLLVFVSGIGLLSTIYSLAFFKGKSRFRSFGYYSILSLLICGLLGMTSTADVFNLYVFLEITSISGYALIAMGGDRGVLSSFRYLLIGTIGASFYLLGVGFIYGETGTLNMHDMSGLVGPVLTSGTTMVAMAFFVLGFGIKMALFPLHGWQPEAYTNAHPGAAPMIAGVMGKIPAYAMLRFFFYVFNANSEYVAKFLWIVGIMSACGMIYGSLKAIRQKDFRRMLAYSSIAQIGYIGLGIAITGYYGLIGAVMHIIGHSLMKSCLFFCAGGIRYRYEETQLSRFGQIYKTMPKTVAAIVISALSMVGIPPLTGFFSKWYLALGAIEKNVNFFIVILILSSLLNAIYFFGLLEKIFMNKKVVTEDIAIERGIKGELPVTMLIPICLTALAIIGLGVFNTKFVAILSAAIKGVAM